MNKFIMKFMEVKFQNLGYVVYNYDYFSTQYSNKVLTKLEKLVLSIKEDEIYMVGHSMGGILARKYLDENYSSTKIKGIITLGTPHYGSRVGKYFLKSKINWLLGKAPKSGVFETNKPYKWEHSIPLGCIVGTLPLGVNIVLDIKDTKNLSNDGTVYSDEAILENCTDYKMIKVSHMGMVYSKKVINLCDNFIKTNKF